MRTSSKLVGTLVMVMTLAGALGAAAQSRPTLAIVDFETTPAGSVLPPPHLGSALAGLMLDRLVASGQYRVLDGRWLKIGRGTDGYTNLDGGHGVREVCRRRLLVLGSMTQFSAESRRRTYGGGSSCRSSPAFDVRRRSWLSASPCVSWTCGRERSRRQRRRRACRTAGGSTSGRWASSLAGAAARSRTGPRNPETRSSAKRSRAQSRPPRRASSTRHHDSRVKGSPRGSVADAAGFHTSYRDRRAESASSRSSDSTTSRSACPHARYTGRHCSSVARPSAVRP